MDGKSEEAMVWSNCLYGRKKETECDGPSEYERLKERRKRSGKGSVHACRMVDNAGGAGAVILQERDIGGKDIRPKEL